MGTHQRTRARLARVRRLSMRLLLGGGGMLVAASAALGQRPPDVPPALVAALCGQAVPPPARLPPPSAGPFVYVLGLCFSAQGNVSLIDPATYLYYIKLQPSRPSQDQWAPYNDEAIATMKADFARLWATNFLDDLRIEVEDYAFTNGVLGKIVTYHMEERQRVKIISYDGSKHLDRDKLEEALRGRGTDIKLDTFLSATAIRQVETAIRQQLAQKGYIDPKVTHTLTELPDGPKRVNLTFDIDDGPKLMIRDVEFIGNHVFSDRTLEGAMKDNRAQGLLSVVAGGGSFKEDKFADDALKVESYYHDRGYADARVGEPQIRPLDDSPDGTTRWIQLRIPVTEGPLYRVGAFEFEGNSVLKATVLHGLFKIKSGDIYRQEAIRQGLEKAREIYGGAGYMEFTGYPDLKPNAEATAPLRLDVTLHLTEGNQYLVRRISFNGNVTTHDRVIRREMQLLEGGVFNTEALKNSVRRLNQLGYFKPIEGEKDLKVEKSPNAERQVDVSLKLQEQNRNQITFGAGVSQYDGVFGNLSFTTANFLGRGESLTLTAQKGSRATNYQLSFTEPTLLDRPVSAGFSLYSNKVDYLTTGNVVGYSQVREGAAVTVGRRLFQFTRLFTSYAYEIVNTAASADFLNSSQQASASPLYYLGDRGRNTESRISPSFEFNTVDNPLRPRTGVKFTTTLPVAGGPLGGTTNYVRPEVETVLYIPHTRKTALGLRANAAMIQPFGDTRTLPYYLRFFLGGEYQIRGVNLRTVGPVDSNGNAIGGTKYVLFNAEYYLDMFGPVRVVLFHDAGQAFSERERIDLAALRTSSGIEGRFMMPVLNVPFRLIYAWNVYRDTFQPAHTFKFAVGTTF